MVTITIGSHITAQGDLVPGSIKGDMAEVRIGAKILRGKLITDLSKRADPSNA